MTRTQHDDSNGTRSEGLPVITHQDAATYLADILPQLAAIARKSGLNDLGDLVTEASSCAAKTRLSDDS